MPITLDKQPGFLDISDTPLTHDKLAFGIHASVINDNAAFGLVRCEVFQAIYVNGDTVDLPTSLVDGYNYSRDELTYIWGIRTTARPSDNWITGPQTLWYAGWKVDQVTGEVFSEEWYRTSGTNGTAGQSNDGQLIVWTIAQRQKTALVMASVPSYNDIDDSDLHQDAPYTQSMARGLSSNAKFGVTSAEVIYMGEFVNGAVVPQPVSPVDGNVYDYADVMFTFSWRWTTNNQAYQKPAVTTGLSQMGPMKASIDATGNVACAVEYIAAGGGLTGFRTGQGRIAVFAFCTRSNALSFGSEANDFSEVSQDHFFPNKALQASVLTQVNHNTRESVLTPEFFGPTDYYNGDTVDLPVSPVDGHEYTREELTYIFDWSNTKPVDGTDHIRVATFNARIDPSDGTVHLNIWRAPAGSAYEKDHGDGSTFGSIRVIVMAVRTADNDITPTAADLPFPTLPTNTNGSTGGDEIHSDGSAVKIVGSQYFTPEGSSASVKVLFRSSNSVFHAGNLDITKAYIAVTNAGETEIQYTMPLTFSGSPTAIIPTQSSLYSDEINLYLDGVHDYYILVGFIGSMAYLAFSDTAVVALHGKIESTIRTYLDGTSGNPTFDQYFDATDIATYNSFPAASDVWSVIAGFHFDIDLVSPPIDVATDPISEGDGDTINGV